MKLLLSTCLLLICSSGLVRATAASSKEADIKVTPSTGKIEVSCPNGFKLYKGKEEHDKSIDYKDANSGEYVCEKDSTTNPITIFVKFRSCDNCIDLDATSISGFIVGDVVATFVIGVAVYLVAKQAPWGPAASPKKGSGRQPLVQHEVTPIGNDNYQVLKFKNGQKDVYDRIKQTT